MKHDRELSFQLEHADEWRRWIFEIPFVPMREGWEVKPIPPFAGAVSRFQVKLPDGRTKSIYLDCYDRLGFVGEPYWEVHPWNGDCGRCLLNETDRLVELIEGPDDEEPNQ